MFIWFFWCCDLAHFSFLKMLFFEDWLNNIKKPWFFFLKMAIRVANTQIWYCFCYKNLKTDSMVQTSQINVKSFRNHLHRPLPKFLKVRFIYKSLTFLEGTIFLNSDKVNSSLSLAKFSLNTFSKCLTLSAVNWLFRLEKKKNDNYSGKK